MQRLFGGWQMERRTCSLVGVLRLQLCGALHTWQGCKMISKQNGGSLRPPSTHIVPKSLSGQYDIQVLNLSRSSVRNCTQYGCSGFSKYSVMTLIIDGQFIQLNFPAAQTVTLPDFLVGDCSAVGLTMLIRIFLRCSI